MRCLNNFSFKAILILLLIIIPILKSYCQGSEQFDTASVIGLKNTIGGFNALANPNKISYNVAIGYAALKTSNSGFYNSAIGDSVLQNCGGPYNTAIGSKAAVNHFNTKSNVAVGYGALYNATSGGTNTAIGYQSNYSDIGDLLVGADSNTSIGYQTLFLNSSSYTNDVNRLEKGLGKYNVTLGAKAMYGNIEGSDHLAIGSNALSETNTELGNTAFGYYAHSAGKRFLNTAIGANSLRYSIGSNNVSVGYGAGSIADSGNVFMGYQAGYNETGDAKLYITNNANKSLIYGDFGTGYFGINTLYPNSELSVNTSAVGSKITLFDNGSLTEHFGIGVSPDQFNYHVQRSKSNISSHVFYVGGKNGDGLELMRIKENGKVSISNGLVNTPGLYKLYVQEGIISEKVIVAFTNSPRWADYVFEDNYKLYSLDNIECYIKKNKHLPGVASVLKVNKEGVDLGEMNVVLLKKTEELYRYIFQLNNSKKLLLSKNAKLKERIVEEKIKFEQLKATFVKKR